MNHTTLKLRMVCKLNKLSISLILLSCFAITSKIGAMDLDDFLQQDNSQHTQQYNTNTANRLKLEVTRNVERVSIEGLQEQDMEWIIDAIFNKSLDTQNLNTLIKLGLSKYTNTYESRSIYPSITFSGKEKKTILNIAVAKNSLELIQLLISIGARIKEDTLSASELRKMISFESAKENIEVEEFCIADEIYEFLPTAKELQEKTEKGLQEKTRMGQNFMKPETKKISDTRFHFSE